MFGIIVLLHNPSALELGQTCHNWQNHEFCTLSENPEGECPAIRLWPQAQAHLGYAAGQWSQTHQQVHLGMAQEKQNEGFGVAKSKSGLKSDWDAVATLQWGWIKTILQRRVGQNSSTAMWKTHCQLSQTLDCSWCCKGWHNQLLFMGQLCFHVGPGRFGQLFSLNKWNHYFKTVFCIY